MHTGHRCCRQVASQVSHTATDGGATTSGIHCWMPSIRCAWPHGLQLLARQPPRTAGLSPLDRAWKPGFSLDTSVFSTLETFVIIVLYKSTFTISYCTTHKRVVLYLSHADSAAAGWRCQEADGERKWQVCDSRTLLGNEPSTADVTVVPPPLTAAAAVCSATAHGTGSDNCRSWRTCRRRNWTKGCRRLQRGHCCRWDLCANSTLFMQQKHTHAHPSNGPFSGTAQLSWYQEGKTNLNFSEGRDSEWQWHQLSHMQVCTLLQTDNYASTPPHHATKRSQLCNGY